MAIMDENKHGFSPRLDFCLAKQYEKEREPGIRMIVMIAGSSHTGKTLAAQRLLERYHFPYLSVDHLKMGLIRSGMTDISVDDNEKLTEFLWPIVREIIKTAIENKQNLTVEGCYLPFDWEKDFEAEYRKEIKFVCLIMSADYIRENFDTIMATENVIERRLDDGWVTAERLTNCNAYRLEMCKKYGLDYILIEKDYRVEISLS